ncbi:transcriptional regulator, RpiR family [Pelagirhabdus alkalitolerans]|uniref:Transcriptional regulator, RpiR family n=1 Tax=Pelagirhabdus alkalitolerans TaxID=1612202 RepID=A0A1G6LGA5_9BACI|nr:ROK family protein [Pelagirhabdus alkalitolerans]SDC42280.1 transcriptional regulator, RpiR family [Pelagirhabdus alkalitolerans]
MREFLTVDIGGTLTKYGVINEDGELLESNEMLTRAEKGGPYILEKVKEIGDEYLKNYELKGVCISTAGQVDSRQGKIIYALPEIIPNYTGMMLKEELETHFSLPVEVENDVNCVGLAESWLGIGKDAKSLFCLTIGTGIGGSYILDNQLHTGHHYSAGEIGYIPIEGDQFQNIASTKSLIRNVALKKGLYPSQLDGKAIFEKAHQGDEICIEAIDELISNLSKGIATIIYMMNPEMVVIGGGISHQKEYLYPRIMENLEKDLIPDLLEVTKIDFASNLNNAGLVGALRNFLIQETLHPLNKIITAIESTRHKLTKGENNIADFVINNLSEVPNLTISEMGKKIKVAEASISRFCKKVDIGTYNNLRILASKASVSKRKVEEAAEGDGNSVKDVYKKMIDRFDDLHASKELHKLAQIIDHSNRIFIIGTPEIKVELEMLVNRLLDLGIDVQAFTERDQIDQSKKIVHADIDVVGVSISGYDKEIVDYMKQIDPSVPTACITSQSDSPVARSVNEVFITPLIEINQFVCAKEFTLYYFIDLLLQNLKTKKTSHIDAVIEQAK